MKMNECIKTFCGFIIGRIQNNNKTRSTYFSVIVIVKLRSNMVKNTGKQRLNNILSVSEKHGIRRAAWFQNHGHGDDLRCGRVEMEE